MATSTSFLSLPLEIRCMMYELCSPPDEEWNTAYPWYKPPAELGPMSLLRVCKQIHDEAVPIFYGNKKFDFAFCWNSVRVGGPKSYNDNTKCIPTRYLRMIRACTGEVPFIVCKFDFSPLSCQPQDAHYSESSLRWWPKLRCFRP